MTDSNLAPFLPRVRWTAHAEPIHLPLAQLIYQLRRHDADDGLLLDALNMADIESSVEQWLALDALTSPYAQLERKMQILQRTLARVSPTLKPVALQLSAPFKQHGSAQITVIFELSDGQTVTIYFHNPDITPNKINQNDELVSWKWLLNKKDITIVVAPEKGHDLNLLDVATRVIKLAEKNSAAFVHANAKRAEKVQLINQLEAEIESLEKELAAAQRELELVEFQRDQAQQQAEQRKQNKENKADVLTNVLIPAGLTEAEMAILIAAEHRKPYRKDVAWEMMSSDQAANYSTLQQQLIKHNYLTKSGKRSEKGDALLEEFAKRLGEKGILDQWIEAQKQKYKPPQIIEEINPQLEKLTKASAMLRDLYDYDLSEDGDSISLSPPLNNDEDEYHRDELMIEGSHHSRAMISFNKVGMAVGNLESMEPAELAEAINQLVCRFRGKSTQYIQATRLLEQGADKAGLHVHYGDFNASVSGGLFDKVSGSDPIIGITAQLHADGKIWARARISETGELDILSGAAGNTIVGSAKSAQQVTDLLCNLMNKEPSSDKSTLTQPDKWTYQPAKK